MEEFGGKLAASPLRENGMGEQKVSPGVRGE